MPLRMCRRSIISHLYRAFSYVCAAVFIISHYKTAISHYKTAISHYKTAISHYKVVISHYKGPVLETNLQILL